VYPISKIVKETEMNTIINIVHNNEDITNLIGKRPTPKKQNALTDPQHQKTKWVRFACRVNEVRRIIKLFQDTRISLAFCTQNTIQYIYQSSMHKHICITEVDFTK
jgi:hypothetical protein